MDTGDLNTNEHIHPAEGHDMPPAPDIDMETSPDATVSGTVEIPPDTQTIENADTAERYDTCPSASAHEKKAEEKRIFQKSRYLPPCPYFDYSHSACRVNRIFIDKPDESCAAYCRRILCCGYYSLCKRYAAKRTVPQRRRFASFFSRNGSFTGESPCIAV